MRMIKIKPGLRTRTAKFYCFECGKKFYTVRAAERAAWEGCPKCNGSDIEQAG